MAKKVQVSSSAERSAVSQLAKLKPVLGPHIMLDSALSALNCMHSAIVELTYLVAQSQGTVRMTLGCQVLYYTIPCNFTALLLAAPGC